MKRITPILFNVFFLSAILQAQDSTIQKKTLIHFSAHYGFIMAHNSNMNYLIKSHIGAGELSFIQQTFGEYKWERVYHNPEKGIGLFAAELGNPQELGQAIGVYPFVNFPLNPGRKIKLFVRTGNGLGLITKPFEKTKNHKNNINGSYINQFIYLRLYTTFRPSKNLIMDSGVGLTHLSNGNFAVPNLGINLMTVNVGLRFQKPNPLANQLLNHKLDTTYRKYDKKPFVTVVTSAGLNESNYRNGKKYGVFSLALSGWKNVSPKSRFGFGLDYFYDYSNIAKAKEKGTFDTNKKSNNLQAGFRLGYEIVVGKFSLPMEMGTYYFSKTTTNGPLYHRVGLRCYLTNQLIINYTLKTHWFTAEVSEFGIGYKF